MIEQLYHGSSIIIEKPLFGYGKPYNDYRLGFYCTDSLEMAKEWGASKDRDGYANCYEIECGDLRILDSPYHEMDIRQFVDRMNMLYRAAKPETNLKFLRRKASLSQRELAKLSGVPMRTIQQYEQRQKNINKAQAEYLVMLARVLCCTVEELLEIGSGD